MATSHDYRTLRARLSAVYNDADEGRDVLLLLLEAAFDLTLTDVVAGALETLPDKEQQRLEAMICRLEAGEPVQYIIGKAAFCGRSFSVNPSVLIPRPETEELCRTVIADHDRPFCGLQPPAPLQILDIGTGSGCIAITLALALPCSEVTAWDLSGDALLTARDNGRQLGARVNWLQQDALQPPLDRERWDVIVSNPPYIMERERADMRENVLDHEPQLALFVPDHDPLLFYRNITRYAATALHSSGQLYFEFNPLCVNELTAMMRQEGFDQIEIMTDFRDRQRFVKAARNRP